MVPTLFGASIIIFVGLRIVPGDPVQMMLGDNVNLADLQRLRSELGLNDPIYLQYIHWLVPMLHGDFGRSLRAQDTVWNLLVQAYPVTFELAFTSLAIAALVGVPAGLIAAVRRYGPIDNALMVSVLFGISMPAFWSGLLMILIFGLFLRWLPLGGGLSDSVTLQRVTGAYVVDAILTLNVAALKDSLSHLILPAIALALPSIAIIARQVRSAMIEVLGQEYITTARSKGLGGLNVTLRHAYPNAIIPAITVIGLQLGYLLSGAIVIETVFSLPGMGRLAILSIQNRDYPVVQAFVLITVTIFACVNLIVDIIYGAVNPQIRFS
jgi:peptide/nickel transport system permease protein